MASRVYISWPSWSTLVSFKLQNQSKQPLPFPLISKFEYAVQEQFFKHNPSHPSGLMVILNHEEDVLGNFTFLYFRKPTLLHSNGVLRTQPSDQSTEFQFFGDLDTNPCKHAHTGELLALHMHHSRHNFHTDIPGM